MKSGERIPRRLCHGVSEQDIEVLDGFGFLTGSAAMSFNEFKKDANGSLTDVINSKNHNFGEKNAAIRALGQYAEQKALQFLKN